jgi:hypothetical protein
MNKRTLVLVVSLAVNIALVGAFLLRPSRTLPVSRGETPVIPAKVEINRPGGSVEIAALASAGLAQLKSAGVPDDVARILVVGRAYSRLQTRMQTLASRNNDRYWATQNYSSEWAGENRREMMKAQREFDDEIRGLGDGVLFRSRGETDLSFLPAAKRDQLRRIKQDYGEMRSENETDNVQLPSDRIKFRLLQEEQERDIVAALSPQELEQYRLRTSNTAQNVRQSYGEAIQTEDDYKRVYALQKAFDDQFLPADRSAVSGQTMAARQAAESKLQTDILSVIGEANFLAAQRAVDGEYKILTSVEKRLNLPAGTADQIFALRDTYSEQSRAINESVSLSPQERRTQLKSLADKASADLLAGLGAEGGEAYSQRAYWLNLLRNGSAFATHPKDAPGTRINIRNSVYPVTAHTDAAPSEGRSTPKN